MQSNTGGWEAYSVGIICALAVEKAAVEATLDDEHPRVRNATGDENDYAFGRIGDHNVVVACLPAGIMGLVSAATVAKDMMRSFPIKIGLMVGICGGVWSEETDVRIGDVIVSQPTGQHGGVVQYDFGKVKAGGIWQRTGSLNKPPKVLLGAMQTLKARHERYGDELEKYLQEMWSKYPRMNAKYGYQGRDQDRLFEASYDHAEGGSCDQCDNARLQRRQEREEEAPKIHYGNIASGDAVIEDALIRDEIATAEGVLCFEMEAAGLMDSFPCVVVRGVCDYADSHKNKRWQPYAAATAACYAKELLSIIDVHGVHELKPIVQPATYLPFLRNKRFVGRETELRTLERRLFKDNSCQSIAIVGLGGTGKTQLALDFAHIVRDEYRDVSLFWVPAYSFEAFEQAYGEIARQLGLQMTSDTREDIKDSVRRYLSSPSAGKWMLIVDNADDLDLLLGVENVDNLFQHLPKSSLGLTVYTTRSQRVAQSVVGSDIVELAKMDDQDAMALLRSSLVQAENLDVTSANQLLLELAHLPLAIVQAASFMNVNKVSVSKYLDFMHGTEPDLTYIMSTEFRDSTRYEKAANAVATTWIVSFEQLAKQDTVALDLLRYMSCIEWKAIPHSILPLTEPPARMVGAIGLLCSYSFLSKREDGDTYDMHRLVQLGMRIWLQQNAEMTTIQQQALKHMVEIFPSDDHVNRWTWREYLPHASQIRRASIDEDDQEIASLCVLVGRCMITDGRIPDAVSWLQESCQRRVVLAEDQPLRLSSQYALAIAYQANGQVKEAVQLLEHIVNIREGVLAKDHPNRLASQHALAMAYQENGQVKEAVQLLKHVVEIQVVLTKDHPSRLASQHELARAYRASGQVKEAVQLLKHVVEIQEEVLAEDHPNRLASQHELAIAYKANGQVKEAVQLLEHVVEIQEEVLAKDHPDRLTSQYTLARIYQENGQVKKAVQLLEYVVKIEKGVLAKDHPSRLASQNALAEAYRANRQVSMPRAVTPTANPSSHGNVSKKPRPQRLRELVQLFKRL